MTFWLRKSKIRRERYFVGIFIQVHYYQASYGQKETGIRCEFEPLFQEGRSLSNLLICLAMDNEEVES